MLEGLPPNKAAHLLRLVTDETTARRLADIMAESFDAAEVAASAFELDEPGRRPPRWIAEVYFGFEPNEDAIRRLLDDAVGPDAAAAAEFSLVREQDWVAASLEGLAPVRAGRFLVHGNHDRASVRTNDVAIEIEAALAFGTGHHGTTRGCLLLFDRLLKRETPRRILDVGTGTGVLAIAAAKRLRRPIHAGDIDPVAARTARENARLNGVAAHVHPVAAPGLVHPRLRLGAPFDLVFANILQRPLIRLAPAIAAAAAARSSLILSGLLLPDVNGVLSAYRAHGFALAERTELEGWAALHLHRHGHTA